MSKKITTGTIASPGIIIGKAYLCQGREIIIPRYTLTEDSVEGEVRRFEDAINKTKKEIEEIQNKIESNISREMADIFKSHIMVLEDPQFIQKAKNIISEEHRNIEWIINDISMELINGLSSINDDYLKDRIIDISDINRRLISNLRKTEFSTLKNINEEVIIFATDLTPSETALMNKNFVLGFVTDRGGKTSHTAIMARALEIPAIVGAIDATSHVKNGDLIILDAVHREIIINPDIEEIEKAKQYQSELRDLETELLKLSDLPSKTLDGEDVFIYGNIEIPEEMKVIKKHGAQGIGLFRSEFLFLEHQLPDEEKQFQAYKKVVKFFAPYPVTIRTLDVGGDKVSAFKNKIQETNPFLGVRAIRFSFQNKDMFKTQLRAILRASSYGNVKLMFPMITTVDEFKTAKKITHETMEELKKEKIPIDEKIPIGMMLEVPSSIINADIFAKYADFFSIGTNDLVQYLLAVDRINENLAYLYNPLDPAFLRFLKMALVKSSGRVVPTSICGQMAGEPQYIMVLIGLGYRYFSMSPAYMYQVKKIIRSVTVKECEKFVESILSMESVAEIEETVRTVFREKFTSIYY